MWVRSRQLRSGRAGDLRRGRFPGGALLRGHFRLVQASAWLSPEELFDAGFDAVFDFCGRDRSNGTIDDRYVSHLIDDVPYLEDPQAIHYLGERVAELVRSGKTVAVNCLSGLDRSGMLVARSLIALGYSTAEAVELVRAARGSHALSNKHFMRFLVVDCTPKRLSRPPAGRAIRAEAYTARPKDRPREPVIGATYRVRRDRIDAGGALTLRHDSRLLHIKVGRRHAGTRVLMLIAGLDVRIVTEDGELIRELTLDPTRPIKRWGTAKVQGCRETGVNDVSRHHTGRWGVLRTR